MNGGETNPPQLFFPSSVTPTSATRLVAVVLREATGGWDASLCLVFVENHPSLSYPHLPFPRVSEPRLRGRDGGQHPGVLMQFGTAEPVLGPGHMPFLAWPPNSHSFVSIKHLL